MRNKKPQLFRPSLIDGVKSKPIEGLH